MSGWVPNYATVDLIFWAVGAAICLSAGVIAATLSIWQAVEILARHTGFAAKLIEVMRRMAREKRMDKGAH